MEKNFRLHLVCKADDNDMLCKLFSANTPNGAKSIAGKFCHKNNIKVLDKNAIKAVYPAENEHDVYWLVSPNLIKFM